LQIQWQHGQEEGGGMWVSSSSVTVTNCTFSCNSAYSGGGMYLSSGYQTVTNCTFSGNTAAYGGGLFNAYGSRDPSFTNCILWGDSPYEMHGAGGRFAVTVGFCDVQGGLVGAVDRGGNIDFDPMFVREPNPGPDGLWDGFDDDYGDLRLQPGSPCINAGDPDFVPQSGETDLDGHARVLCGSVDMGAYEFGIGDFDCDQNVNLLDVAGFQICSGGQMTVGSLGNCEAFDFDVDQDVDANDWAAFQLTYQGVSRHCSSPQGDCVVFTLIDFEGVPAHHSQPSGRVTSSYADWGVIFYSIGSWFGPGFYHDDYGNPSTYAGVNSTTYPPGFNLIADFYLPVFAVSSDVMCSAGNTVTMIAKDAEGNTLSSVTSQPAPATFWTGPIFLDAEAPIASVEWWPSIPNSGVGIDNLKFWSR
jgi:hypothetical protein